MINYLELPSACYIIIIGESLSSSIPNNQDGVLIQKYFAHLTSVNDLINPYGNIVKVFEYAVYDAMDCSIAHQTKGYQEYYEKYKVEIDEYLQPKG